MAYAALSNLPAIYGLYASTIAGYVGRQGGREGREGRREDKRRQVFLDGRSDVAGTLSD